MEKRRLIIVGSGPAGYTAAIYAARADLQPLLFTGIQPGGQLTTTTDVENWPGEVEGIMGTQLMENLKAQALRFGTEVVDATVADIDLSVRPFKMKTEQGEYEADAVIVATGASAKWLGVPGEDNLKGKGVSACATCDGFFFRDKKIVMVGGGDSAMEEAIFLTRFAETVTVLVRRDELRASKIMQKRAMDNSKIKFLWNTETKELIGTDKLESVKVLNNKTQEETDVPADGFFVAIGHKPNTDFLNGQIELDENGYIKNIPGTSKTSLEGVFACGDVIDPWYRQAITSAGTGCIAALDAERWLINQE
ncbi:thioredoxin-disulfide reductase [Candidatus Uhrbacteria bacterium]|jgi:thioredoxin reductase (NADPH)|nr:thioredoxin-disulfide reductase [Candidatus Uhrbacteria bacterium]MBT7717073.1 thioredoxin-disulfide reductase [Candidatus Uhrbacteria bacterium]